MFVSDHDQLGYNTQYVHYPYGKQSDAEVFVYPRNWHREKEL